MKYFDEEIGSESRTNVSNVVDDNVRVSENQMTHAKRLHIARSYIHSFCQQKDEESSILQEALESAGNDKRLARHIREAHEKVKRRMEESKGVTGVDGKEGFLFYVQTGKVQRKVKLPHEEAKMIFATMLSKVYAETQPVDKREDYVKENFNNISAETELLAGKRAILRSKIIVREGQMSVGSQIANEEINDKNNSLNELTEEYKKHTRIANKPIPIDKENITVSDVQRAERIAEAIDTKQKSLDSVVDIMKNKGFIKEHYESIDLDTYSKDFTKNISAKLNEYNSLSTSESLSKSSQKFIKDLVVNTREQGFKKAVEIAQDDIEGIEYKSVRELKEISIKEGHGLNPTDLNGIASKVNQACKDVEGKVESIEDELKELQNRTDSFNKNFEMMNDERLIEESNAIRSITKKIGEKLETSLQINQGSTKENDDKLKLLTDFKVEINQIDQKERQKIKTEVIEAEARKSAIIISDTNLSKVEIAHVARKMFQETTSLGLDKALENAKKFNEEAMDETLNKHIMKYERTAKEAGLGSEKSMKDKFIDVLDGQKSMNRIYKETLISVYTEGMDEKMKAAFVEKHEKNIDFEARSYTFKDGKLPLYSQQAMEEMQQMRKQEEQLTVTTEIQKIKNYQVSVTKYSEKNSKNKIPQHIKDIASKKKVDLTIKNQSDFYGREHQEEKSQVKTGNFNLEN